MRLTICSPCTDHHKNGKAMSQYARYLNLNVDIIDLSNVDFEWIVGTKTGVTHADLRKQERKFPIVNLKEGSFRHVTIDDPMKEMIDQVRLNSVEHGLVLNGCYQAAQESDFVLFLDPDFYILSPIEDILNLMEKEGMAFFGAPYAQSATPLVRDFPVAFCLFVDRRLVPDIDLSVGYGDHQSKLYPDVGYNFYAKYKGGSLRYDYAVPVVNVESSVFKESIQGGEYSYTTDSFRQYGIEYENSPNKKGTIMDEYFYQGMPFAFHSRAKMHQSPNRHMRRIKHQLKTAQKVVSKLRSQDFVWRFHS